MSTPNPALVAASPYLKQAIADVAACLTTILTGPVEEAGLRAGPAAAILVNQLALLAPGTFAAEQGVVLQDLLSKLNGLSAKLP
jgi:hypothetical protein